MRLRHPGTHTLLLLLPALGALAASAAVDVDDKLPARAVPPAYPAASAEPDPSPAPQAGLKGTKDAPVDGFDGKPHHGPYVDDKPTPSRKLPAVVEDLKPGKTSSSAAKDSTLVEADDAVLDGDKSVMQDPDRKMATGKTGTEGGVSAKDKERLAHEEKHGEKMEKVPEPPKEAPPLPHGDQKHLQGDASVAETVTRALGAVGLEVSRPVPSAGTPWTNESCRNPPTSPTRPTTSPIPYQAASPPRTRWPQPQRQRHPPLTCQARMPAPVSSSPSTPLCCPSP